MATYKIQHRNDTTANWNTHNPVLLKGEIGIEYQSSGVTAWKVGDGVKTWSALPYSSGPAGPAGPAGPTGGSGSGSGGAPSNSPTTITATVQGSEGGLSYMTHTASASGWYNIMTSGNAVKVQNNSNGMTIISVNDGDCAVVMPVRSGSSVKFLWTTGATCSIKFFAMV